MCLRAVSILQHVPHEGPGRIVPVFRDYGIKLDQRKLYAGDEVPSDLDEIRALVVLGGPMGIADVGKPDYPFLAQEVSILRRFLFHPGGQKSQIDEIDLRP